MFYLLKDKNVVMEGNLSSLVPCRFTFPKLRKMSAQLGMFGIETTRYNEEPYAVK